MAGLTSCLSRWAFDSELGRMTEIKFNPGYRAAADEWTSDGEKISAPEKHAAIKKVLEKDGPVLVEHKFLRGA